MINRLRLFFVFGISSLLLVMAGFYGTFFATPLEVQQIGFTQKIFYFHVPMAISSGVAFLVTLIASIAFLVTKERKFDVWAYTSAEVGLIFGAMLLTMGVIWTRSTWGVWWTWDPRLTSYLVVMLLYSGYFVLRSSVENEMQRARYAAALGIVGYISVVFTMISTRIVRSNHPVLFKLSDPGVEPPMLYTFLIALFGTFLLLGAFLIVKVTLINLREEIEHLKDQVGS